MKFGYFVGVYDLICGSLLICRFELLIVPFWSEVELKTETDLIEVILFDYFYVHVFELFGD